MAGMTLGVLDEKVLVRVDELDVRLTNAHFKCTKCRAIKPAGQFGLRRMGKDSVEVRNQAQCMKCRGVSGEGSLEHWEQGELRFKMDEGLEHDDLDAAGDSHGVA